MDDKPAELNPFEEHVLTDLHELTRMVTSQAGQLTAQGKLIAEMHAELETYRPVLAAFKPGNGTSDVTRAGLVRGLRKAAKGGQT